MADKKVVQLPTHRIRVELDMKVPGRDGQPSYGTEERFDDAIERALRRILTKGGSR